MLDAVVRHAAALLGADAALVAVSPETSQSIRHELGPEAPTRRPDGATVVSFGLPAPLPHAEGAPVDPVDLAAEPKWAHTATHEVSGGAGHLGELWVARAGGADFTERDRGFLRTLASLAGIALSSAQMREGARQRAVLSERTRIAREMHDSLAQVLGAVHLRLRALETGVGTLPDDRVVAEVEALADICAEAYQDVRETILGLRDAVQPRRAQPRGQPAPLPRVLLDPERHQRAAGQRGRPRRVPVAAGRGARDPRSSRSR